MKKEKIILLIIHYIIIINFALEIFYGAYQIFYVLAPGGNLGPLWGASTEISFELMVTRRLYAIETWIAIAGLSIYLALTEMYPRMKRLNEEKN